MTGIPQRYHDTCNRVQQQLEDLQQQQQQQQLQQASSSPRSPSPADAAQVSSQSASPAFRVVTLPAAPPNVDFVRKHFPVFATPDAAHGADVSRRTTTVAHEKRVGRVDLCPEVRYAMLLQRIEDEAQAAP